MKSNSYEQDVYGLEDFELSIEHSTYTFKFKEGV